MVLNRDAAGGAGTRRSTHQAPIAFAAVFIGAVAMGASPVFVRYAEIGPFASAFWRVTIALPLLLVWASAEAVRRGGRLHLQYNLPVVAAGVFFAGDLIFWHLSIFNTTIANATLMSCLAPVWVLLLSRAAIGEKVERRSYSGAAICLAGAALLVGSSFRVDPGRLLGDFYGLVTSIFFGLYFLAVRVGRRTHGGGALLFLSTIVTAAILLLAALIAGGNLLPETAGGYLAVISLGVVSHVGGQGLLAFALGSLSAAFSSLVIFVEAVAGALFGLLLFDEAMGPAQIAGALLILAGVWLARPREKGE